jgi:peroxiredoxin Q/BCP
VSSDPVDRHAAFAASLDLPFPLLCDDDSAIARAFGVTRAGGFLPSKRVTFVIDRDRTIRAVIAAELSIRHHAEAALSALAALDEGE